MGRGRSGVYLNASRPGHLRLAYTVVRELARAANQRAASRVYIAYQATKAIAKMLMRGWIRVDPGLAERLDEVVPAEPWWVKRRVAKQLAEESMVAVKP